MGPPFHLLCSNYPFASRKIREEFATYVTGNISSNGNDWYSEDCIQLHVVFEYIYPHAQPENVYEIHAVSQFRDVCNEKRSLSCLYAAKHQESTGCKHHTINGAECPS